MPADKDKTADPWGPFGAPPKSPAVAPTPAPEFDEPTPDDTSNRAIGVDDPDPIEQADAAAEPAEPAPSMSMTKAELLERVKKLEDERDAALTKAELIERAKELEAESAASDDPTVSKATLAAMPGVVAPDANEIRSVTINGETFSWTDATADTVPAEAVEVYRRYRQANS